MGKRAAVLTVIVDAAQVMFGVVIGIVMLRSLRSLVVFVVKLAWANGCTV